MAQLPVWRTMLADPEVQGFYAALGFSQADDIMARHDWGRLRDENEVRGGL